MSHRFETKPIYNKTLPHIFVVCVDEVDYEYINTTMLCAFDNEADAYNYCKDIQEKFDEIKNKAIIDIYGKSPKDLAYSILAHEFEDYLLSTYFNNKDVEELDTDEFNTFNEYTETKFKSWMINNKHIEEDIAESTIEYHNNYNDYSDYEYYYDAVPYYIGQF